MISRVKQTFPARLGTAYGQSKAGGYAAALAFNSFLTMFPVMLGILAIIGFVIRDPGTQAKIQEAIVGVFPSDAHAQLLKALGGVKHNAGLLGIISFLGLLWTGTGYFSSMEWALTQIFGSRQRDLLRQRVMGLVMMVVFVVGIVVAVTANNAAAIIPFAPVGGIIVGLVVMIGLLIAIYRFVPNRTFSVRDVLPGALFAGILIEIFTVVFPIYARLAHGFNTYGQQFALFFLLATWLYFLAQLLLLGAVFIRMRVGRPADEGIAVAPEEQSKTTPAPVEAIDQQKREAAAGIPAGESGEPARGQPQPRSGRERDKGQRRPWRPVKEPTGARRVIFTAMGSALGLLFASRRRRTG